MKKSQADAIFNSEGKKGEDSRTADLVELLRRKGFPNATAFPIHKRGLNKPDAEFSNGGLNIISAKISDEKAAMRTANEYQFAFLHASQPLGEVFAVTYPASKKEDYRLYVLPSSTHREGIPLVMGTLEEMADAIVNAVEHRIEELQRKALPPVEVAQKMLVSGAVEIADALFDISEERLEEVFGGHDFFHNCLDLRLSDPKTKARVLRQGPAHLFVNQLLFYALLSEAEQREKGGNELFPPISEEDSGSPIDIHNKYFERVKKINYEPIFGSNVGDILVGPGISVACKDLVHAINGLVPRLNTPDLIGQVFQTLIPPEIRKPLGANYTNPRAADLLSMLTVKNADDTIMDPACGSGTLLVAGYRRKKALFEMIDKFTEETHKRFVEQDITGTDALAIASHLAAINLAAQHPLTEIDHVRIAKVDSTRLLPGMHVRAASENMSTGRRQLTLGHTFSIDDKKVKTKKSPHVIMKSETVREFVVEKVNVFLMNPPFTSWDNMQKSYRETLNLNFSNRDPEYKKCLFWKVSQQAHFILLADTFLHEGGTLGAVIPLTTLTGKAFHPLVEFLIKNYTIRCIVYGIGRSSFSEQTALSEILLVAEKRVPPKDYDFVLVGTKINPSEWDEKIIRNLQQICEGIESKPEIALSGKFRQSDLSPQKMTLPGMIMSLDPQRAMALGVLERLFKNPNFTTIENIGADIHRWVLGSEHIGSKPESDYYGTKGLFASRTKERALKEIDRLVYSSEDKLTITFYDKVNGTKFSFNKSEIKPAIRRFSKFNSFDITGKTDFVISKTGPNLERVMRAFYKQEDVDRFLKNINASNSRYKGGRWQHRIMEGSTNISFAGRLDLAASGTNFIALHSEVPYFLAGYGYMVKGLDEKTSKLVTLWLNSSMGIFDILCRLTQTRGTWTRIESYVIKKVPIPDPSRITEEQWDNISKLFDDLKILEWPSLLEQLEQTDGAVFKGRSILDSSLLQIFGMDDAVKNALVVEEAIRDRIFEMKNSMGEEKKMNFDET